MAKKQKETSNDELARITKRGFDEVNARIDKLSGRIEKIEYRYSTIDDTLRDFRFETRSNFKKLATDLEARIENVEERLQI